MKILFMSVVIALAAFMTTPVLAAKAALAPDGTPPEAELYNPAVEQVGPSYKISIWCRVYDDNWKPQPLVDTNDYWLERGEIKIDIYDNNVHKDDFDNDNVDLEPPHLPAILWINGKYGNFQWVDIVPGNTSHEVEMRGMYRRMYYDYSTDTDTWSGWYDFATDSHDFGTVGN